MICATVSSNFVGFAQFSTVFNTTLKFMRGHSSFYRVIAPFPVPDTPVKSVLLPRPGQIFQVAATNIPPEPARPDSLVVPGLRVDSGPNLMYTSSLRDAIASRIRSLDVSEPKETL